METKTIERDYLERNSSYMLERSIIESMNDSEVLDFITPLKLEYETLKDTVKTEYEKLLRKHKDLSELSEYFLYKVLELQIGGKRLDELESILVRINSLLFPKISQDLTSYPAIDIKNIPVVSIIGQYVKLPGNLNKNICCPLHTERTPSFRIYEKTNSWFCFGCNKGGNILNFISEIEGISTKEAYKKLISFT